MAASKARKERRKKQESQSTPAIKVLAENPDIQIREVEGMGRGLFWCPSDGRMLPKGTTLLRLEPEMIVPDDKAIETHCHVCFSNNLKILKACSGCKVVRYCSATCEEADQPLHQKECIAMSTLYQFVAIKPGEDPLKVGVVTCLNRLTARLIWKRPSMEEDWWKPIDALHNYKRQSCEKDNTPRQLCQYIAGYHIVSKEAQDDLRVYLEDCTEILSRARTNCFEASCGGNDRLSVGTALSTTASLFNHSCDPNVTFGWSEGLAIKNPFHFSSHKDIQSGEQLFICYIKQEDLIVDRQNLLRNNYGFQCCCPKCDKERKAQELLLQGGSVVDAVKQTTDNGA